MVNLIYQLLLIISKSVLFVGKDLLTRINQIIKMEIFTKDSVMTTCNIQSDIHNDPVCMASHSVAKLSSVAWNY